MRVAAVALLLLVAACDTRITDTGAYGGRQSSSNNTSAALIGRWSFTRYFTDDAGALHLSTTVWEFASGGAATRTVYADNITAGVGDVVVTTGAWSADSRTVTVFFTGSSVPVGYSYRFVGGALILGDITFTRLSS